MEKKDSYSWYLVIYTRQDGVYAGTNAYYSKSAEVAKDVFLETQFAKTFLLYVANVVNCGNGSKPHIVS